MVEIYSDNKKKRLMTVKGAIPPTEEQIKKSDEASKRLKKIEARLIENEVKKKQRKGNRGEECYWPASARGTAELSWDELLYEAEAG